jgi:predicted HD phosphohydrolase
MTFDEIKALFKARGGCQYSGEPVTQLEHALQTAQLAEAAGASDSLITACLLHDFGHMANDQGETPTLRGVDDKHQFHGVSALKGMFGPAVLTPIRLHVDAKRYLCATDAGYWARLSEDSKRSLELQGGTYTVNQTRAQQARQLISNRLGANGCTMDSFQTPRWRRRR